MTKEELLSAQVGRVNVQVSPEWKRAIADDPFLKDWNNRLFVINRIYDMYCEEHEIPRFGIGDPPAFPRAVIDTCLQNGLLRYENGKLTAKPR